MKQMDMTFFPELCKKLSGLISKNKRIVIIPHKDPDGDAIGSALAWFNVLKEYELDVSVVSPNEIPASLYWMNGCDNITIFKKEADKATSLINEAQLLLFLDFNGLSRTGKMEKLLAASVIPKVIIDHHPFPDLEIADLVISDTTVSSTCELSYLIMIETGFMPELHAAECLYAGIMTDTGMLNHNSSTAGIYRTIADLIDKGIDKEKIHREVYHSNSLSRMRLFGHALCNKLEVLPSGKVAYIVLSESELKKYDYKPGDTEGLVNYPLSVDGIEVAALITEKEKGLVKISLRSQGDIAVNHFSEIYFSGGGHMNAAGGEWKGPIDSAVNRFCEAAEKYFQ